VRSTMIHNDNKKAVSRMSEMLRHFWCQLATVSWQQPSASNSRKMNQVQPHPCTFLKCKNSFLCLKMYGMMPFSSCKHLAALKRAVSWQQVSVLSIILANTHSKLGIKYLVCQTNFSPYYLYKNLFLFINQVYYWRYKSKMHKCYRYFQRLLK